MSDTEGQHHTNIWTTGSTIQSPMGYIRYLNLLCGLHVIQSRTKAGGGWGGGGGGGRNSAQHT